MKRIAALCLTLILVTIAASAQEIGGEPCKQDKKIFTGCDGGMMLHAGYLQGTITPLGYKASGCPFGVGGVARVHLGQHWRVGAEGYMSTLHQMHNGSYLKYGWGGILGDFYWIFGRFMPYAGVTIGGGALTDLLMFGQSAQDWTPVTDTYYNKQGFMAIDPFVGCEFFLTERVHLTLKVDCLCSVGRNPDMPIGPRIYFGFIFNHFMRK